MFEQLSQPPVGTAQVRLKDRAGLKTRVKFLLRWVVDYYERDGDMSLKAHSALFESYPGPKRLVRNLYAQLGIPADAPKAAPP